MQRVRSRGRLREPSPPRGSSPERSSPAASTNNLRATKPGAQGPERLRGAAELIPSERPSPAASSNNLRATNFNKPSDDQGGVERSSNNNVSSSVPVTTSQEEAHPRGHQTLQKRLRLVGIRMYHRLGNLRLQLFLAALVALLLLGLLTGGLQRQDQPPQFAVYIDGGSSGTRVHVFQYTMSRWPSYVELVLPEQTTSVEPGLSSYAGRPAQAAESLNPLVDFALKQVPTHMHQSTPIFLLATAGLRLLSQSDADDILVECSQALSSTPFLHREEWATVISGDAEGVYAWTAVNYVSGALEEASLHHHHSRKEMLPPDLYQGVLELGGASFQITFMPADMDAGTRVNGSVVPLPGVSSRVFTHSYLGLGMDAAMQQAADAVASAHRKREDGARAAAERAGGDLTGTAALVAWDPCLPSGYQAQDGRMGNASFEACMAVVQQVLPARQCTPARGKHHGHDPNHHHGDSGRAALLSGVAASLTGHGGEDVCTFAGVHVPHLMGTKFIALENFFWTARALGLGASSTLAELREAGVAHCARSWSTLHDRFAGHVPDQFITRYCFGAVYVHLLLHDRLGIHEHHRVLQFTNTIKRRRPLGKQRLVLPGQVPVAAAGRGPGGQASGSGQGGGGDETEVGLTWVVGAVLVHAMNGGRHGQADFSLRGGGAAGAGGGAHGGGSGWWLVLLPAVLALLLLAYVLHGRVVKGGGKQGGMPPAGERGLSKSSVTFAVVIDGRGNGPSLATSGSNGSDM